MIAGDLILAAALAGGGHCGGSYTPAYSYGYSSYSYSTYVAPYVAVQAKIVPVATEYYAPYAYGQLLGTDIRAEYRAKDREEEREALITELQAIRKALAERPAPTVIQQPNQEIQTFSAPRPSFGPSPQQAAPQQAVPQQAPRPLEVPEKNPYPQYQPPLQPIGPPSKTPGFAPAPAPPRVPAQPSGDEAVQTFSAILSNRCASCHTQGAESGGLALFDPNGDSLPLSTTQLRKIDRAVSSGRMPRGTRLPEVEAQALEDAIVRMYQQASR